MYIERMLLSKLDDALKMMLLRDWCGPYDYIATISTSKLWSCAQFLRSAAYFAVSRMHAPGRESSFAMAQWNYV